MTPHSSAAAAATERMGRTGVTGCPTRRVLCEGFYATGGGNRLTQDPVSGTNPSSGRRLLVEQWVVVVSLH